jgi:hypothetical protein
MSVIEKILIMNMLPIPDEVINYIKPFIFHDIIHKSRKIKNNMISMLNCNFNAEHYSNPMTTPSEWIFILIQNDTHSHLLHDTRLHDLRDLGIICKMCMFCLKCGNYLKDNNHTYKQNILCKCD